MTRICIAGVGAVGTTVAARLVAAGADVHLLARGARLRQLLRDGLCVDSPDGSIDVAAPVSDRPDFGIQDIIFVATKAHGLAELLPTLGPLMGPNTVVAPLINGIPWWYFQGSGGRFAGDTVAAVDPTGSLRARLATERILGCVLYLTAQLQSSGRVTVMGRPRIVVGAIEHGVIDPAATRHDAARRDGHPSADGRECADDRAGALGLARANGIADLLVSAGIGCAASAAIRNELWAKVALNLATNPLSVVTEATLREQFNDTKLLPIVCAVLDETSRVARGYGAEPSMSMQQMLDTGRKAGAFETSMLQDYRAGRTLELDAIAYAVLELARKIGEAMPTTQLIVDLCAHRAAAAARPPT